MHPCEVGYFMQSNCFKCYTLLIGKYSSKSVLIGFCLIQIFSLVISYPEYSEYTVLAQSLMISHTGLFQVNVV